MDWMTVVTWVATVAPMAAIVALVWADGPHAKGTA